MAENTGSRTVAAIRFGSPLHFGSPALNSMRHFAFGALPTYGSSSLMSGLPAANEARSLSRKSGFPSSWRDSGPRLSTSLLPEIGLPLRDRRRFDSTSRRYGLWQTVNFSMCMDSPCKVAITNKLYHADRSSARGNIDFIEGSYRGQPKSLSAKWQTRVIPHPVPVCKMANERIANGNCVRFTPSNVLVHAPPEWRRSHAYAQAGGRWIVHP